MASKLGNSLNFSSRAKIAIWLALVAVGVCGRLWQPAYNVTPFAAIGLAAGSLFGISLAAASVPIVALVISNMVLPGYGSTIMTLVVYGSNSVLACMIFSSNKPPHINYIHRLFLLRLFCVRTFTMWCSVTRRRRR